MVALMSQAHAWSKMTHPMKLTTWAARIIKDSIKKDHQDSIIKVIFHRAKVGDPIQGIISTMEVHLISLLAKNPPYKRKPPSRRNCWYSSCRLP